MTESRLTLAFVLGMLLLPTVSVVEAQGTRADYERSRSLPERFRNKVTRSAVSPQWLEGNRQLWYRNDLGSGRREYVRVDCDAGTRQLAFDHARLAAALAKVLEKPVDGERLELAKLSFVDQGRQVQFQVEMDRFQCDLDSYELRRVADSVPTAETRRRPTARRSTRTGAEIELDFVNQTSAAVRLFWLDPEGQRKSYGSIVAGGTHSQHTFAGHVWMVTEAGGKELLLVEASEIPERIVIDGKTLDEPRRERATRRGDRESARSPDGKWEAVIRDHNVYVKSRESGIETPLSQDGTPNDHYRPPFHWSPDSRHLVVVREQPEQDHRVHVVQSSPKDQTQPKLLSFQYLKPGDTIAHPRPQLFDVEKQLQIPVSDDLYSNPWSISEIRWSQDSRRFTFLANERGHQTLRVISVDAATGAATALVDERSPTFIDYAFKTYLQILDESSELLWMSERSGWNHLYLIDANTGAVKNAVTSGEWVIKKVDRVDPEKREIWFQAVGVYPEQDPYYVHYGRVRFDGSGLTWLTAGDGTHHVEFSPDNAYLIDTYSRVDVPPVTELRRAEDGALVCELERAEISRLREAGWKSPERFVAKGRDGKTDIYGVIFRPLDHDPARKYPVVEQIYAGPHGAFVPKAFSAYFGPQSLAELGFIVVQIDGMGTNWRSREFHDICWKNIADAGFPDRISWMQAAAKVDPSLDLTRVGIYGGSAGGQNALAALLFHPESYHVAVADCGCHDNRMDKIWWNEAWMGWPVGSHYAEQSNVTNAHRLQGKLLLTVGEIDHNVDPASTMQVVNALIAADKDFELIVFPGADHGAGSSPYGVRRRNDFLVRHLLGVEPRRE